MKQIKYRKGYKYQLAEDYTIKIDIIGYIVDEQFLNLTPIGVLIVKSGYAWDGPSGPTIDTNDSMRGSLVHDAIYQLMRLELIPQIYRSYADELLKGVCLEDGMPEFRAEYWFHGVDSFAASAADPKNRKKILVAP